MLSLFPELLFLSPFAAFVIRIAVAVVFARSGWSHVQGGHSSWVQAVGGILLVLATLIFVGLYTQIAALSSIVVLIILARKEFSESAPIRGTTLFLMLVLAFSLVLTGPGPFAFDLPL